ncbi:hypothetical protein PsorP6_006345 [Peronosclerospora sorghi]|uniref:Uncharacterized protein n=1 Tax=Peronosclerospora sorghi TaxID=230839 RepID=A0ACC0W431_9STRA|nr:hypothetical protein PsorP6_006345 [Peronosclerospora sorghi]
MVRQRLVDGAWPFLATSFMSTDSYEAPVRGRSAETTWVLSKLSRIDTKVHAQRKELDHGDDQLDTESETSSHSVDSVTTAASMSMASDVSLSRDDDWNAPSDVDDLDEHVDARFVRGIASNLMGRNVVLATPFGPRAQCYADYSASGKAIRSIETFIHANVLPMYGNTHTTTSITGLQTTAFREEARAIIGKAVHANLHGPGAQDVVIFSGQGCPSAMHKFVAALGLQTMRRHRRSYKRPMIFTSACSHDAHLRPWHDLKAVDVIEIPDAPTGGGPDLHVLERLLQRYRRRALKIGTFAAASSLTGTLARVDKSDMNPKDPLACLDAVFFSGHEFVGAPGSPGVLIVKKALMTNEVPTIPGGGTVVFVTDKTQCYLANNVEREEGGTPDLIGSIRLGLAFELKQRVDARSILALEREHVLCVRHALRGHDDILLLGPDPRHEHPLAVFSFLIRFRDRFLHPQFVSALLHDLFGIQTHACAPCPAPVGARVLGLRRDQVDAMARDDVLQPGVVRMRMPYFVAKDEVEYILAAVKFVAQHGWKFLPQYDVHALTGAWRHVSCATTSMRAPNGLARMPLTEPNGAAQAVRARSIPNIAAHRGTNLAQAAVLADLSLAHAMASDGAPLGHAGRRSDEPLRWFVYAHEVVAAYKEEEQETAPSRKDARTTGATKGSRGDRAKREGGHVVDGNDQAKSHGPLEAEDEDSRKESNVHVTGERSWLRRGRAHSPPELN